LQDDSTNLTTNHSFQAAQTSWKEPGAGGTWSKREQIRGRRIWQ